MSRSLLRTRAFSPVRYLLKYVPAVIVALVASGTAFALSHPQYRVLRPQSGANGSADLLQPNRYCYNWDFLNNTGQDANDLHIRLAGIQNITDVYTGTMNVFGEPDPTSGYEQATNVYVLNFSGDTVYAGEMTHIGICTDQPLLALDSGALNPAFTWSIDGAPLDINPSFAGLMWNWVDRGHLQVQLMNDPQVSMTLMSLNVLDAGYAFALNDLNKDVAGGLPLVSELVPDPLDLLPGQANTFDVYFSPGSSGLGLNKPATPLLDPAPLLEPNHPYVLEAVLASADDPGNTIHLYSQALAPLAATYIPIAQKD